MATPRPFPAPELPATITALLEQAVRQHPDRPFLGVRTSTSREASLTFREFGVAVDAAAARLAEALQPRDLVFIQGSPGPQYAAAIFAAARANVILIPLDIRMTPDTIERIWERTAASAFLLGSGATIEPATSPRLASLPVIDLDDLIDPPTPAQAAALAARVPAAPDEPIEILYTSGSTASPKGAVLDQSVLLASTRRCLATIPAGNNRMVSILPLSHIMEQVAGLIYAAAAGAETEYIATLRPDLIAAAIREHRATALIVVPQVLELLLAAIRREADKNGRTKQFNRALGLAPYLPRSLRRRLFRRVHEALGGELQILLCSAAHLPPPLQRSWEALGIEVVQGYGSTEAGLVTTNFLGVTPPGRVGWALPPLEVRIAPDEEIQVRGPSVFGGYWQDPEANAQAFTADGWYRTGDMGELASDGSLRLIGRARAMFAMPNGMKVHPEDVEGELMAVGVVEPVVFEHSPGTIAFTYRPGAAFSIAPADEQAALTAATKAANARLAPHQRISGRVAWPDADFPRTHTRKVRRGPVASRLAGAELTR
jgi:long-chain acyl-CoA synthetase